MGLKLFSQILVIFLLISKTYSAGLNETEICFFSTSPSRNFKELNKIILKEDKESSVKIKATEFIVNNENFEEILIKIKNTSKCSGLVLTDKFPSKSIFDKYSCQSQFESFFSDVNALWISENENIDYTFPNAMIFGIENNENKALSNYPKSISEMISSLSKEIDGKTLNFQKSLSPSDLKKFKDILIEVLSKKQNVNPTLKSILTFLSQNPKLIPNNGYCEIDMELIKKSWEKFPSEKSNKKYETTHLYSIPPLGIKNENAANINHQLHCFKEKKIDSKNFISKINEILINEYYDEFSLFLIFESLNALYKQSPDSLSQISLPQTSLNFLFELFTDYIKSSRFNIYESEALLKLFQLKKISRLYELENLIKGKTVKLILEEESTQPTDFKKHQEVLIYLKNNKLLDRKTLLFIEDKIKPNNPSATQFFISSIYYSHIPNSELFEIVSKALSDSELSESEKESLEDLRNDLNCYDFSTKAYEKTNPSKSEILKDVVSIIEDNFCTKKGAVTVDITKKTFDDVEIFLSSKVPIPDEILSSIVSNLTLYKNYFPEDKFKIEWNFFRKLLSSPQAGPKTIETIIDRLISHTSKLGSDNFWIVTSDGDETRKDISLFLLNHEALEYKHLKDIKFFYSKNISTTSPPNLKVPELILKKAIKNSLLKLKDSSEQTSPLYSTLEGEFFELKGAHKLKEKYLQIKNKSEKINFLIENL